MLSILRFKQFPQTYGKNGIQNRMQSKRIQIKPTLNVKITLHIDRYCQQNQEMRPPQHYLYFERIFRK